MKIKPEHYNHMERMIHLTVTNIGHDKLQAHKDSLKDDERVKDINKRFRWDICHAAQLNQFMCEELYEYLNDDHIDTALRQVIKNLEL